MSRLAALVVSFSLLLAACGDFPCECRKEEGVADASSARVLVPREAPLEVGDVAPAFDGLPAGPVVLVFYRGHW